ncbi:MAG: 2-hydroxyacyl-CoA dehydratase [Firmicutes bacterium]|nr:2-hydroxyacyl-CoA dehydratase [Bacillota bacterium]
MGKIGITTTIPVEVILAAGETPVDLNNIFITDPNPGELVKRAEEKGLPRNLCSWVKGIYSVLLDNPDIERVIAVTEGDCANTVAMLDLLKSAGIKTIPFSFPYSRTEEGVNSAIASLEKRFGVKRHKTEEMKIRLDEVRKKALIVDELTYKDNKATGLENHLALICCSDFEGDPDKYEVKMDNLIAEIKKRPKAKKRFRIGYCGVPAIFSDLYEFLEKRGASVVFNEMQRQFAMPFKTSSIVEQYMKYTYPYTYTTRIEDIREQAKIRKMDGIIHYIQSFCHHQIYDRALRESLELPSLTLEGDKPGSLKEQTCIRLESFLEMLSL